MFKGFGRSNSFKTFPSLNFQVNNEAYGFSGCTFWLDAAYGLNTQTDLAAVSSWQARIGGITFTQSTAANQPRLVLSDVNFNNLPVIECTDANRRMTSIIGGIGLKKQSWTLAFIGRTRTIGANAAAILGNSLSSDYYFAFTRPEATDRGIAYYNNATPVLNSTIRDTVEHICIFTGTEVVIDGVQKATVSEISGFTYLDQLFSYQSANGTSLNGYCAEIIVYDKKLTSSECIDLSTRLNSKYAIY